MKAEKRSYPLYGKHQHIEKDPEPLEYVDHADMQAMVKSGQVQRFGRRGSCLRLTEPSAEFDGIPFHSGGPRRYNRKDSRIGCSKRAVLGGLRGCVGQHTNLHPIEIGWARIYHNTNLHQNHERELE